jgi:spermidine synthase
MIFVSTAVFFASGFAALLYQVIWQRLLVLFSGADLYSVTIIVAAFMGGMGAGHLAGGHIADRTSARRALLLFALAEFSIAIFGLFSRALYYDFLYDRLGGLQIPPAALAALLFVSLLWPTFFMGATPSRPTPIPTTTSCRTPASRAVRRRKPGSRDRPQHSRSNRLPPPTRPVPDTV